jgi:hypothetical protein
MMQAYILNPFYFNILFGIASAKGTAYLVLPSPFVKGAETQKKLKYL